jgi:DNA primase
MILNLDKLEGLKRGPNGSFIARCPVCAKEGRDLKSNHLSVQSNGVYNCIIDSSHNKGVFQLVGNGGSGVYIDSGESKIKEPEVVNKQTWSLDILKSLIKEYSYWEKRGISAETCEKFKIGTAYKGQMAFRTIIPIINKENTKIVGFTGRALKDGMDPKWKHIGSKNDYIFPKINIEQYQLLPKEKRKIVIVESPADVLTLAELNIYTVLCTFGTSISSKQMGYILGLNPEEILISTNNEPNNKNIGLDAALKMKRSMLNIYEESKIKIILPDLKDFNEYFTQNKKDLLDIWVNKYL